MLGRVDYVVTVKMWRREEERIPLRDWHGGIAGVAMGFAMSGQKCDPAGFRRDACVIDVRRFLQSRRLGATGASHTDRRERGEAHSSTTNFGRLLYWAVVATRRSRKPHSARTA